jgi:hypothetical protein
MIKIKVVCKKCNNTYEFLPRWAIKNDINDFVCRLCKIKNTTQSNKFKNESRDRSLKSLSDEVVKSKMSIIATINNAKNAEKISKSLRKYYQSSKNKSDNSNRVKKLWGLKNYRNKISGRIKGKWLDNDYRLKVLTSKDKKDINVIFNNKDHNSLKLKLNKLGIIFEENFFLGIHKFDFLIDNKILIDLDNNSDKKLFIEHYFKQYKYKTNF